MRKSWKAIAPLVLAPTLLGCGDDPTPPPAASEPPPAPQPVETTQPATQRALVEVEPPTIEIAGQPYLFPPMRLRAEPDARGLSLQLYGADDPRRATGHTLLLDMQVDATALAGVGETPWRFASPDEEWTDTPRGMTLSDERFVLRPADVTVRFFPGEGAVGVDVSGTFLMWDLAAKDDAEPTRVKVDGAFSAAVVEE